MSQSLNIGLRLFKQSATRQLQSGETNEGLLNMMYAHREVEPVKNVFYRRLRRRSHQCRPGRVTVADRGHRAALLPTLIEQRRAQQDMVPLSHTPNQGKAATAAALSLDLAADHLEVPHLVTRHHAHIEAAASVDQLTVT
jgi:hypothetical protein